VAVDNNCIDRLVTEHNPTHVIIEALWVVPSKFAELTKLHPNVTWIIRLHSEMPFMAGEGIALDWMGDYASFNNVLIACNAPRMLGEVRVFLKSKFRWSNEKTEDKVIYLPNFYPQEYSIKSFDKDKYWIDISCFGAVRPLKNHVLQALAALKFANSIKKQLRFHVNGDRIEMKGDPILNNLKGMFQHFSTSTAKHEIIMHTWCPREQFLKVCSDMDIGMQCNHSETFNIVSADLVSQGVPIVGSSEIPWASRLFNAEPYNSDGIAKALTRTYMFPNVNVRRNQKKLYKYTNKTRKIWENYFKRVS